jgi:hypothetical protein
MALLVDDEFRGHADGWGRFVRLIFASAAGLAVILLLVAWIAL